MNKRRPFRVLFKSIVLTLLVGLAMPGLADDTEIYWRQQQEQQQVTQIDESTRPNILFVLDNSGSMLQAIRNEEDGKPQSQKRIDVLKEALVKILTNPDTKDVNVGLARFASLIDKPEPPVNAPIMFPVAHIDDETNTIPGEEDDSIVSVSVPINYSNDDAEENVGTKKVSLRDKTLEMVSVISEIEPDGIRVDNKIASSKDDALEWSGSNATYPFKTDEPIHYLGNDPDKKNKGESFIGLRFQELGIPQGATIVHAELELHCPYENELGGLSIEKGCGNVSLLEEDDQSSSNDNENADNLDDDEEDDNKNVIKVNVYGAAFDGKPGKDFSGVPFGEYPEGVEVPAESVTRHLTRNFNTDSFITTIDEETGEEIPLVIPVELPPLADETGKVQEGRTFKIAGQAEGGLAPIVQAIVNRENWEHNNSLVLLLERYYSPEDPPQTRAFYSFEGNGEVPLLRVYWSLDGVIEKTYISGWNDEWTANDDLEDKLLENHHKMIDTEDNILKQIRLGKNIEMRNSGATIPETETKVGLLFPKIDIPSGAKIIEAKLVLTQQGENVTPKTSERNDELTLEICAEKIPNADTFNDTEPERSVGNRYLRPTINCGIEWHISSSSDSETTLEVGSDIVKPILEELMGQSDWHMGNNMVFLFQRKPDTPTTGYRRIVSADDLQTSKEQYKVRNGGDYALPSGGPVSQIIEPEASDFINAFKEYLPRLSVKYTAGLPEEEVVEDIQDDKQYVGLRFEGVDIPQGAKIVSANIEFTSDMDASISTNLKIQIEDTSDALPFTDTDGDISNRVTTSKAIIWRPPSWKEGVTYTTPIATDTTPDLSVLLQDIVDKSDWCGGKGGLVFIISDPGDSSPLRNAKSYDNRPAFAPKLNVQFDSKDISGNACVWQNWTGRVSASDDDAEEKIGVTTYVYTTSPILELGQRSKSGDDPRLVGFRFQNVPISQGAKIVKAHLIFTSRNGGKDRPGSLRIFGEKSPNASSFITGPDSDLNNSSKRPKTSKINWKPEEEEWQKNMRYQSPDIKSVIQEIIEQPDWRVYNNLALFIDGGARYDVASFDIGPSAAPMLRIQVEGMLGEDGEGSFMTVRRRLTRIVQEMDIPNSRTAIVDALYESSRYFLSGAEGYNTEYKVDYGKSRHGEREYLVSHPGSYKIGTGTVTGINKAECNVNVDPLNAACANEEISGEPVYQSPITTLCQTNHLVLLTDGLATRNTVVQDSSDGHSQNKIQALINELGGSSVCMSDYPEPTTGVFDPNSEGVIEVGRQETCGIDLADALFETGDQIRPSIIIHTIGFQLGKGWESVYQVDDRPVYKKNNVFYFYKTDENSPQDSKNDTQLTEDQINRLQRLKYKENTQLTAQNKDAVKYLCRLASQKSVAGFDSEHPCPEKNFYLANTVEDLEVAFNQITTEAVDSTVNSSLVVTKMFASPGVSISRFNNLQHDDKVYYALFESDNKPLWDGNVKKYRIEKGVLMGEDDNPATTSEGNIATNAQSYWSGSEDGDKVAKGGAGGNLDNSRNILTYLGEAPPKLRVPIALTTIEDLSSGDQKMELAKALLGDEIEGELTDEQENDFDELKEWIVGGNRNTWAFADPLHSSPKVITYGGTSDDPDAIVFVGTNDGLIHALDAKYGTEKWAFLPKEMLPLQQSLKEGNITNGNEKQRFYGIDGASTFWSNLGSDKTSVDPAKGDFVKMFTGMRRGGKNIYALDVTIQDEPKLMWVIKGKTGDYTQLGQTWSSPRPTKVDPSYCEEVVSGTACIVLLFGGGYDVEQDESINSNNVDMGNAIYMAHANTGKLLWWASNQNDANLTLDEMDYPIPSNLTVTDSNEDGYTDRIYVGDVGGQVWRIDLDPNEFNGGRGGRLLTVSALNSDIGDSYTNAKRTFFYSPAVTKLKGTHKTIVAIVSGTRPHPLPKEGLFDAHDQFYAFVDPVNEAGSNWEEFSVLNPISDFTDVSDLRGDNQVNIKQDGDKGWYLSLCEDADGCDEEGPWLGEKGFSATHVVDETVYFSTYVPPKKKEAIVTETKKDACTTVIETVIEQPDFGYSRLYKLNLLTGAPIDPPPEDGDGDDKDNSKGGAVTDTLNGPVGVGDELIVGDDGKIRVPFGYTFPVVGTQALRRIWWTQVEE